MIDLDVLPVHSLEYVQLLKKLRTRTKDELFECFGWQSVYTCEDTMTSVRHAVGGLMNIIDSIYVNEIRSGIAIIRPPGHHAETSVAGGFCLMNNVAIAAKHAMAKYKAKR